MGNQNPDNIYIPLVSISVGNGMTSPITQVCEIQRIFFFFLVKER